MHHSTYIGPYFVCKTKKETITETVEVKAKRVCSNNKNHSLPSDGGFCPKCGFAVTIVPAHTKERTLTTTYPTVDQLDDSKVLRNFSYLFGDDAFRWKERTGQEVFYPVEPKGNAALNDFLVEEFSTEKAAKLVEEFSKKYANEKEILNNLYDSQVEVKYGVLRWYS